MLRNVRKKLMKSFEQFSSHFGEDFSYINLNLRIIMKFRRKKNVSDNVLDCTSSVSLLEYTKCKYIGF